VAEVQQKEMMCAPRAQLEWGFGGRRKIRDGALLVALFIGGIGAGQFVVSSWLLYPFGAVVGLIFVAVGKSAAHLVYLGRPARFLRLFMKPKTSWISRGLIAMMVLVVFGAAYLAPYLAPMVGINWTLWTLTDAVGRSLFGVAMVAAFIVMIYDGFVLNSCKSISSWHTMLLPVMFFFYSVAGGVAMSTLMTTLFGGLSTELIITLDTFLLSAMLALVAFYIMNLYSSDLTGRESLRRLMMGRTAVFFIGLALIVGLLVPIVLTLMHQFEGFGALATSLLAISALLELAGDLSVRHSILKAGLHAPVM